jgi:transcription antitermination factor NusG
MAFIIIVMKAKNKLSVGDKVKFHSGNFEGLTGTITKAEYGKQFEPYGLRFTVQLSNGKIGYIEKAEHWHFL